MVYQEREEGQKSQQSDKKEPMQFMPRAIAKANGDPRVAIGQQAMEDCEKPNGRRSPADISVSV